MSRRKQLSRILARYVPGFFVPHNCVFIIGCARSGTTLLTQLLSQHQAVANWSEANDVWDPQGYPWRDSACQTPPIEFDPVAFTARWVRDTQPRRAEVVATFGAYQWLTRKPFFLNKSPLNTFRIPELLDLFPDARFIHMIRDGRAVAHSYTRKQHDTMQEFPAPYQAMDLDFPFETLALKLATFWKMNLEEVARQDETLHLSERDRLIELTYEDLCADTMGSLDRLCDFFGLAPGQFDPPVDPSQIKNQNHKWAAGFEADLVARLVAAMEPVLSQRGYV